MLDESDEDIHFIWAADDYQLAHTSVLMKVIGISYILDQKSTPREAAEAAMYETVQMVRDGREHFGSKDKRDGWEPHPEKKILD